MDLFAGTKSRANEPGSSRPTC